MKHLKRWKESYRALEEAIRLESSSLASGNLMLLQAKILLHLKRAPDAVRLTQSALQRNPSLALDALDMLGDIYRSLNKPYDARNFYLACLHKFSQKNPLDFKIDVLIKTAGKTAFK
jgi:tetratricopeptide (TPR) repeat protein